MIIIETKKYLKNYRIIKVINSKVYKKDKSEGDSGDFGDNDNMTIIRQVRKEIFSILNL